MSVKIILVALLALAAGATAPLASAHGWGGPRFSVGINLGMPLYYPEPYYYYPAAPVVYMPAPPVVVQAPPSQVFYQYYCPSSSAYYPAVPTCEQPWLKVVPDGTVH